MEPMFDQIALFIGAQPPATGAAEAVSSADVTSVWDFVRKGGVMMIPLGLCSLVALTVVFERLISLRKRRIMPAGFVDGLREKLGKDPSDAKPAIAYCQQDGSPLANVFAAGLKRLASPLDVVERHIEEAGQREVIKMRKYLRVLAVIAAVSPLLGLLGTIIGMIVAFQTVATSGEALGKTEMLATGIYQAMITTAAGLVVAIPALICYHWLTARVQAIVIDLDQTTMDFIDELHDQRVQQSAEHRLSISSSAKDEADERSASTHLA